VSEQKGFPWVNLWLLVFSVSGIWLVWRTLAGAGFPSLGADVPYLLALPVLLVIGITALYRMPVPFTNEQPDDLEPTLTTLARLYLDAWRTVLRLRWVLILFGVIALVNGLELVTQTVVFLPLKNQESQHGLMRLAMQPKPLIEYIQLWLASDLAFKMQSAPGRFMSALGAGTRSGSGVAAPIAIVLLLPWLGIHLKRMADHPSLGRTARMLRGMLVPIGILALMAASASYLGWKHSIDSMMSHATPNTTGLFTAPVWVWSLFYELVAVPFLTGGLIGSLLRSTGGKLVSGETFVRDAVRYLLPLMGLVLITTVAGTLVSAPIFVVSVRQASRFPEWFGVYNTLITYVFNIARMLLMLVPYAIVTLGLGSLRGLRTGFVDWMSHQRTMIRFAALGISIFVPVQLIQKAATETLGRSTASFAVGLLFAVVNMAIAAWLSVAVWELYRRIGSTPPEVLAQAPGE
jgi:hypothetical protein